MDFEVGSGPQNSTIEGVFQIRLGLNPFTAATGISTLPPFVKVSPPAAGLLDTLSAALTTTAERSSGVASVLKEHSTGFPALASNASRYLSPTLTSKPLSNKDQTGTGMIINSILLRSSLGLHSPLPGTGSPRNTLKFSSRPPLGPYSPPPGKGSPLNTFSSRPSLGLYSHPPGTGSPLNTGISSPTQSAPIATTTGGAINSGIAAAAGGDNTGASAAAAIVAAGAAAAAGIFANGGDIAAAAAAAAGVAASNAELAAGGDAAAAAAAAALAEAAASSKYESEEQDEDEREDENQSLERENRSKTQATSTSVTGTVAPLSLATTTPPAPATTAPGTSPPVTSTPATLSSKATMISNATSVHGTSTPVKNSRATSTTATLYSNRTMISNGTMTASNASSTCAACATCLGFSFGANWPDLGSTISWANSSVDTEDDWDADVDDDEFSPEDADGEEGDVPESDGNSRRAWAGRFKWSALKKRHLHKRIVKAKVIKTLGQCAGFQQFVSKPPYYNAMNVVNFENQPKTQEKDDKLFMAALIRWVVPISTPPGDCSTVPTVSYLNTAQCKGDAPLPDGSTFSKTPKVGEQVWQVGGAPNKVNVNREVNIDHVYEAKYLNDFFDDLTVNQGFDCVDLKTVFGSPDGAVLTNLFANLPSKYHPEFIGMAKGLNSLKEAVTNKIWNQDLPLSWLVYGRLNKATGVKAPDITAGLAFTITGKDAMGNAVSFDPANDLEELTTAAEILDVVNTPEAIAYMSAPNDRIYAALQAFGIPCRGGPSWADRYKTYLLNRFATRNVELQNLFNRVLTKIGPNYRPQYMAAWKQRYPMERMQLPPPTSWAADFPPIQQAMQAEFASNPASLLGKRQAFPPAAAGACMLNGSTAAENASSTGSIANAISSTALAPVLISPSATSSAPAPLSPSATIAPAPIVVPPATSQTSTAAAAVPSNGDPCGPAHQDNPNYPNTCAAKVDLTSTPESYGVYCGSSAPTNIEWASCKTAYNATCANILWAAFPTGAWVWNDPGSGCAVGVWMPAGTGNAMVPSVERCNDLIFEAMTDSCSTTTTPSNVGSVNLNSLPSFSDKTKTGTQVDFGYPSYIIAPKSPSGLTKLPLGMGWSTAQVGGGGTSSTQTNSNNQYKTTNFIA